LRRLLILHSRKFGRKVGGSSAVGKKGGWACASGRCVPPTTAISLDEWWPWVVAWNVLCTEYGLTFILAPDNGWGLRSPSTMPLLPGSKVIITPTRQLTRRNTPASFWTSHRAASIPPPLMLGSSHLTPHWCLPNTLFPPDSPFRSCKRLLQVSTFAFQVQTQLAYH